MESSVAASGYEDYLAKIASSVVRLGARRIELAVAFPTDRDVAARPAPRADTPRTGALRRLRLRELEPNQVGEARRSLRVDPPH